MFAERRPPPPSSLPTLSVIFLLHIHSKVGAWIVEGAGTGRRDSSVPKGEGPGDTTPGSPKEERAYPPSPLHCWVLMEEGRSSGYVRGGVWVWTPGLSEAWEGETHTGSECISDACDPLPLLRPPWFPFSRCLVPIPPPPWRAAGVNGAGGGGTHLGGCLLWVCQAQSMNSG